MSLFICIFATSILEMRWSGVGIDNWWRNEQFWVIGGVSSHLFAVFQGLLKVIAGVDTSFTVTSKGGDDEEFSELYTFKWTTLLIPPTTLLLLNFIGVVAGVSNAINNGYESWGPLFGKLFFAFWVIVHLYPFLKGLVGRQNRTPKMVARFLRSVVWIVIRRSAYQLPQHQMPEKKIDNVPSVDKGSITITWAQNPSGESRRARCLILRCSRSTNLVLNNSRAHEHLIDSE